MEAVLKRLWQWDWWMRLVWWTPL